MSYYIKIMHFLCHSGKKCYNLVGFLFTQNIAPSDYHLLQSLEDSFNEKKFQLSRQLFCWEKKNVEEWTDEVSWRWQKIVEQNGKYVQ